MFKDCDKGFTCMMDHDLFARKSAMAHMSKNKIVRAKRKRSHLK